MSPDITRVPPRASKYYAQTTQAQTRPQARLTREGGKGHWLLGFGLGMLIFVSVLFIAQFIALPSYHHLLAHWMYGEYPVSHIVADIGHGGKSDIYAFGVQGSAVVLVSIMDVNADGKPDLVIHTDGTDTSAVLFNTGKSFQDRP